MSKRIRFITRQRLTNACLKKIDKYEQKVKYTLPGSRINTGAKTRLTKAMILLVTLETGQAPSNWQVAGYFGAGARLKD